MKKRSFSSKDDVGVAYDISGTLAVPRQTFILAETYDPKILPKRGTYGTRDDAFKARDLDAKADATRIKEAKARMEALYP
jgi:hypothetical protein